MINEYVIKFNNLIFDDLFIRYHFDKSRLPLDFESFTNDKFLYTLVLLEEINKTFNSVYNNESKSKKYLIVDDFLPILLTYGKMVIFLINTLKLYKTNLSNVVRVIDSSLFMNYDKNVIFRENLIYNNIDLENIEKIRKKKLNVCFLGFGGGNSNFAKLLFNTLKIKNKPIFNKVAVIEFDEVEYHNILRLPYPETYIPEKKLDFAKLIIPYIAKESIFIDDRLTEENLDKYRWLKDEGFIIIGGPDLQIRKVLAENGFTAIYPVSSENEFEIIPGSVYKNIDLSMVYETYGKIFISTYGVGIINLLKNLLDILANEDLNRRVRFTVPQPVTDNREKIDTNNVTLEFQKLEIQGTDLQLYAPKIFHLL